MSVSLHIRNLHPRRRLPVPVLRRWLRAALAEEPIAARASQGGELGIRLVGAARMARLNRLHLGHEGPTDVITFDYAGPTQPGLWGDIVVCLDVAEEQGRALGIPWPLELLRYLVHGLLHLCGFDDLAPAARRIMKRHENRLVRRLGARLDWAVL